MKTLISTVALSFLLLPVFAHAASAQTADEVVNKYIAAIGGREALGKLHSRRSTGTVSLSTPNGAASGPAEIYLKAPNKTRAVLKLDLTPLGTAAEMTVEQIFDGKAGFSLNSMQGDMPVGPRQLDAMRNNSFPTPLMNYKALGYTLEVLPKETVNGRDAIVLKATPKTGAPSKILFDATTFLVMRTISTVDSQGGADAEQTSDLSDYRTVDGVKVPFKIVNTTDLQTLTITLTKVEHNVAIDDAMFVKK